MTVSVKTVEKRIACDGATKLFPLAGLIYLNRADLVIKLIAASGAVTQLVNGNQVTLGGDGSTGNGTLTTNAVDAYADGAVLYVRRETDDIQNQRFDEGAGFPAKNAENAYDRRTLRSQEQSARVARAVLAPDTIAAPDMTVPVDFFGGGKLLAYDPDAGGLTVADPMVVEAQAAAASAQGYAATLTAVSTIWSTPFDSIGAGLPDAPTEGLKHINTTDGTGNLFRDDAWESFAPPGMQLAYVKADGRAYRFNADTGKWFYAGTTIDARHPPFNAKLDGVTSEQAKWDAVIDFVDNTFLTAYFCGAAGGMVAADTFDYTGKQYHTQLYDVGCDLIGANAAGGCVFGTTGYDSDTPASSVFTRTVKIYGQPTIQPHSAAAYTDAVRFFALIDSSPMDIMVPVAATDTLNNASVRVQYSFDGLRLYGNAYGNTGQAAGIVFENDNCNGWDLFLDRCTSTFGAHGVGMIVRGSLNRMFVMDLSGWDKGVCLENSKGCMGGSYFESNVTAGIGRNVDTAGPIAAKWTGYVALVPGAIGADMYFGAGYANWNTNLSGFAIFGDAGGNAGTIGTKLDWATTIGQFQMPYAQDVETRLQNLNGHFSNWQFDNRDLLGVRDIAMSGTLNLAGDDATGINILRDTNGVASVMLGDNSGYGAIRGKLRTHTAYTAGAPGAATGYVTLFDSAGTAVKVPVVA